MKTIFIFIDRPVTVPHNSGLEGDGMGALLIFLLVSLNGRVLDATQAGIAGAQITAIAEGQSSEVSTVSGERGDFSLPLPPGKYTVQIAANGFEKFSQSVDVDASASRDF